MTDLRSGATTRTKHENVSQCRTLQDGRERLGADQRRGQNTKMCLNAEHSRMEGNDLEQTNDKPGVREKSCHLRQQAPRLQREPEQPYCGICQAYVEKCVCKEPRPLWPKDLDDGSESAVIHQS